MQQTRSVTQEAHDTCIDVTVHGPRYPVVDVCFERVVSEAVLDGGGHLVDCSAILCAVTSCDNDCVFGQLVRTDLTIEGKLQ